MPSRPKKTGLADVLFGRNRGKILGLLFGVPDRSFYLRQIAAAVGTKPGTIAPELALLTDLGLLVSTRIGNQVFYKPNQGSPIFPELKSLLVKTVGVSPLLRLALGPLAGQIELAFVYGSLAKREETAQSDVDLMLVGDVELEDVLEPLQAVEKQIQRPISPTVYSSDEFGAKLAGGNHFLTSVLRGPKIFVIGGDDELRRLGG